MPPKRSKAAASQPVSASQPLLEPQRPTRASARKRRHSDGSNVSEQLSESTATPLKTPAKKRKRGRPTTNPEPEVIVEEEEEMNVDNEPTALKCNGPNDAQAGANAEDTIEVLQTTTTKHVHFGSDEQEENIDESTTTHITPHPRSKMTVKRRTLSPNMGGSTKRFKTSRTSLPTSLTQGESSDAAKVMHELQFTPLRELLEKRMKELSERKEEASISDQDEQQLDGANDTQILDPEMMVLDSLEELKYPQLPMAPATPTLNGEHTLKGEGTPPSEGAALRASWEAEREQFRSAVQVLGDEANAAKRQLQILNIELEAVGFAEEGATSIVVVQQIRESFARVREFLETELPDTIPEDASNQELLETLVANVKEFADRLRTMDKELRERGTLAADLGNQIHGLVDHLAEKEIESKRVSASWQKLDKSNEDKDKEIADLEENVRTAEDERDDREAERDNEIARANTVEEEKADLEKTLEKLSESLQKYREEEARLTNVINELEEGHRDTVGKMNKEREETYRELESQIDNEASRRGDAEAQVIEHEATITELQTWIEAVETEREDLKEQLEAAKAERDIEKDDREAAEVDLQQKQIEAEDLEERVGRLEEELEQLRGEMQNLRETGETQRQQREAAETELDDRNADIEEIRQKLYAQGKEANELRLRLHNVQTENEQHVKQLQDQMSDRDEQFQEDMAVEVRRREGADELAQQRAVEISDLQASLDETEARMAALLNEKDERIAELEEAVEQKDAEIQNLQEDLRSAETAHEFEQQQARDRVEELEGGIAALQETISSHEGTIRNLQQQAMEDGNLHKSEILERDARIAELDHQLAHLRTQVDDLQNEKVGLEHRVEEEAEDMLQLQNEKAEEIEALKKTIRDKHDKILNVEEKAHTADQRWQEVLAARDEEVERLQTSEMMQGRTITDLSQRNEKILGRFRDYVRRSSDRIAILQEQVNDAAAVVNENGNAVLDDGEGVLEELEGLFGPKGETDAKPVEMQAKGAINTRGQKKKKREIDSGIGMEGETLVEV